MFLPYIFYPTRLTGYSQTIVGNIYCNYSSKESVCGNLYSTIPDHLFQVLFTPFLLSDHPATKSIIFERRWINFHQTEFVRDYFDEDWSNILNL